MSRKERVVAALLLAVAVGGGALIPRLLSTPAGPLGVALAPGPGTSRSVVQAPAISTRPRQSPSRSNPSSRTEVRPSPVARVTPQPIARQSAAPPTKPATQPTPPPPSPPSQPPPPPPPPPTTTTSPPPALMPQAPTRPGHGYGDKNHVHTGPPGHADRPAAPIRPARRSHSRDLSGSTHGRPPAQAPSHPMGHRRRGVGRLASPASGPAAHAHGPRPQARPEARGPRGEGGHGAPAQVTHGHGKHSSPSPAPPAAPSPAPSPPAAPAPGDNGHGQSGQAEGHQGHGKS